VGAQGPDFALTFAERCVVAGHAFWFYLGRLVWPADLCFVYARWPVAGVSGWPWVYPVTAAVTVFWLWLGRERIGRGPAAAAFYFVGTLFPVLGFMNAYFMRYSFVCDHWVYVSSLGVIALAVALVVRVAGRLGQRWVVYGCAAVVLPVLAVLTWRQAGMYADSETLWRTTVTRNPQAWMAYDNLGSLVLDRGQVNEAILYSRKALEFHPNDEIAYIGLGNALLRKGQADEAMVNYQKALELLPGSAIAHYNLANMLLEQGDVGNAIRHYQEALKTQPDSAPAHNNLGSALLRAGRVDEAIVQCQKALVIQPDDASTHNNLGNALLRSGQVDEAVGHYQRALAIRPDYANAHNNLGNVLFEKGQVDEAVKHYQMALAIDPDYADAHNNLGIARFGQGHVDEAVLHWRAALKINPQYVLAQRNLAWVLATCPTGSVRNGAEAVALALQADQLSGGKDPVVLQTLAAAYAESGRFADAIVSARQALELSATQTDRSLDEALRAQIGLYQAGLPFRDKSQTDIPVPSSRP
jgi:tetratricopeptide (TPR) repeat protein